MAQHVLLITLQLPSMALHGTTPSPTASRIDFTESACSQPGRHRLTAPPDTAGAVHIYMGGGLGQLEDGHADCAYTPSHTAIRTGSMFTDVALPE